jgi:endonuclease/exonuclease/phosphatase family metal-dependent hydrolase
MVQMKKIGIALAGLVLLLGLALLVITQTNIWVYQFAPEEPGIHYQAARLSPAPNPDPDSIRILNWNIKFGGGRIDFFFDCYGDRVDMTEAEVLENLALLAAKIREVNPDIVMVQEVDVNAQRSAYVDQVQWLLDHTDLNYAVYASQWQVKWVPSNGIGRMNMGNAILSRWPIGPSTRIALPLMAAQDPATRFFYLRRHVLTARLAIPGADSLTVLNTHVAAYSLDDTRAQHIQIINQLADSLQARTERFVLGGDLNTLPPGTPKCKGFPDSVCPDAALTDDDYCGELDLLKHLYATFREAVPLADYLAAPERYYSHTVDGLGSWNRRLDYLFTNAHWHAGAAVLQHGNELQPDGLPTFPLSDHAPLFAIWRMSEPTLDTRAAKP